jgi:phage terminase small subunit
MDHFTTLTPKQALFCAEYFVDFNATKAALRAGYSPATALSGKLMTIPKIKMHLQQRGAKLHEDMEMNNQAVLDELKKIAFATMGDYLDADGKIKPMNLVSDDAKAALLNYSVTEGKYGPSVKIRLGNKLTALEKIARLLNFYGGPPQEVNYWILDGKTADAEDGIDDESQEAKIKMQDEAVGGQMSDEEVCSEQGTKSKEQGQGIEADIERRIAEAVAETERRLRAEFALERGAERKEHGAKRTEHGAKDSEHSAKGKEHGAERWEQGQDSKLKNTDFYHPVLENQESGSENQDKNGETGTAGQVVGANSNYGGDANKGEQEVVKKRRFRMFQVKAAPLKRNVKYLRIY